jgi:outer membrane protein OmpA-like peptidoglycan-associated protein
MYEYDDGGGDRPIARLITVVVALVAVALLGWFVVRPRLTDDGESAGPLIGDTLETTTTQPVSDTNESTTPDSITASTGRAATATIAETTTLAQSPARTTDTAATTSAGTIAATTSASTIAATPGDAPYDTLPDGSPAPVVALYDVSKITLTGAVPDQAAKDRLQALAIGNAKPGQDTVENFLTINPSVPRHVGVRVVELTSVRFPEGSAEVLPAHALELDRVVSIMNALPNVTALVIGHADQRGSELTNYEISEERADAVVDYIAARGIAPSRLSSRAVGETDLLTLNNEPAALELNRRTEFVFYGLLLE